MLLTQRLFLQGSGADARCCTAIKRGDCNASAIFSTRLSGDSAPPPAFYARFGACLDSSSVFALADCGTGFRSEGPAGERCSHSVEVSCACFCRWSVGEASTSPFFARPCRRSYTRSPRSPRLPPPFCVTNHEESQKIREHYFKFQRQLQSSSIILGSVKRKGLCRAFRRVVDRSDRLRHGRERLTFAA